MKKLLNNTYESSDSNAILGTNPFTLENELVTPLTFECGLDKVNFITPGYRLYILGSNCY